VRALERAGDAWRLIGAGGEVLADADVVCLAAGLATRALAPGLPLSAVRGQAVWSDGVPAPPAAAFGAYVIPTRGGVLFGATHDRGDEGADLRAADTDRCLADLAKVLPRLAERLAAAPLAARAAIRVATPDRLPIAGALGGGRFVLAGLGGRGFTLAPLVAEHVAALASGAPSPLPADLARLLRPERFAERAAVGRAAKAGVSSAHTGTA